MAIDYSNWTEASPLRFDDHLTWLFERFMVGSLAIDASMLGGNFDEALSIKNSNLAQTLLKKLQDDDFSIDFKDKVEEVETSIEGMLAFSESFWSLNEFLVCYRTEKAETRKMVTNLREYIENNETALAEESNELIMRRFFEIDSVLRYIRNGLAHGRLRRHDLNDKPAIFLFNVNESKSVTAVMSLTFERLEKWYELFCNLARREL